MTIDRELWWNFKFEYLCKWYLKYTLAFFWWTCLGIISKERCVLMVLGRESFSTTSKEPLCKLSTTANLVDLKRVFVISACRKKGREFPYMRSNFSNYFTYHHFSYVLKCGRDLEMTGGRISKMSRLVNLLVHNYFDTWKGKCNATAEYRVTAHQKFAKANIFWNRRVLQS